MKKNKKTLPAPFAAPTKDIRFAGTYEVLVPVEGRVRPHRVALQFATLESAQSWIHSADGKEAISEIVTGKDE
jgi:antibiotic biosynthesis monooxygenase (ABM) superfamily enzyme